MARLFLVVVCLASCSCACVFSHVSVCCLASVRSSFFVLGLDLSLLSRSDSSLRPSRVDPQCVVQRRGGDSFQRKDRHFNPQKGILICCKSKRGVRLIWFHKVLRSALAYLFGFGQIVFNLYVLNQRSLDVNQLVLCLVQILRC